ncbi:hypothetical protein CKK34_4264 [Yarrowia sp. E02]|nr:hypothetical protein CKK34_4264 [Yarrowia sp. E02]
MLLNLFALLPLAMAYNTFQNQAVVDPKTYSATTEDVEPLDKLRNKDGDTGTDMVSHFRDESGNVIGSYDESSGEISSSGKVVGHANDTGFFDASGVRRGLAKTNSTRIFYAPDQSFIGGVFSEPKQGPGSEGFTWDNLNEDYKDLAEAIGPKAGVVRDLSGFLTPRTRFYIRDNREDMDGDGAEMVYLRNNTMDTLQIETDYTYQLNLTEISQNYTMSVDTGRFDFGDNGDDYIEYSNSSMLFNDEYWGDFLKQTGFGTESKASKSDLDLSPIGNLSFVDSNDKTIGGVYNLDVILDKDNNMLYVINPDTWVVSNAEGYAIGKFNNSDYSFVSNDKSVLGKIVLKEGSSSSSSGSGNSGSSGNSGNSSSSSSNDKNQSQSSSGNAAPASSTAVNGAGATLPTAAAALVIPFFLLMV